MERILLNRLLEWKTRTYRKPLVLYGTRQTGKTWLLKHFGKNEFQRMHYINFESDPAVHKIFTDSLSPSKILPQLELHIGESINTDVDLLFFDEIQQTPEALTSLKYFYEEKPELAIVCAGSFIELYGAPSSFPVGKITALTLHPLSFEEFLLAVDPKLHTYFITFINKPVKLPELIHDKLWNRLTQYYYTGGMPEAVLPLANSQILDKKTTEKVHEIHSNLILGYRSDFAKHSGSVNANHIYRLFEQIPTQLSRDLNQSTKRFIFKDAIPDAKRFRDLEGPISWLNATGLINICHVIENNTKPLSSNIKSSMLKLYLHDTGILHSLLGIPSTEIITQSFGTYKGYTAENYTAAQLFTAEVNELYNWKNNKSEIEFLMQHNEHIVPIEVKSGRNNSKAKSLGVYREKHSPKVAIKMSGRNFNFDGSLINLPLYAACRVPSIIENLGF